MARAKPPPIPVPPPIPEEEAPDLTAQTVAAIVEMQTKIAHEVGRHQRRIEIVTEALARPAALYILLLLVVVWIIFNIVAPHIGLPRVDPWPFFWLQGVIGLIALIIATMVLITQNRQGKLAARRALLDLHVNLLAEQKVAKLIALVEELRRDLPSIANRHDPQAAAMVKPVDPAAALNILDERIEQALKPGLTLLEESAVAAEVALEMDAGIQKEVAEESSDKL